MTEVKKKNVKTEIYVILSERSEPKDLRISNLCTANSAFGAGIIYSNELPRSFDYGLKPFAQDDKLFHFLSNFPLNPTTNRGGQ